MESLALSKVLENMSTNDDYGFIPEDYIQGLAAVFAVMWPGDQQAEAQEAIADLILHAAKEYHEFYSR
jgi:hypothetical protein